jgi:sarcosine oxidase
VVLGCGFSGHGFKFTPVLGEVLADLATGRVPSYDLSMFDPRRFAAP